MEEGVIVKISEGIIGNYKLIISSLPDWAQNFINLFLIVLLIFLYSIFVWKFYKFVSKKNIIGLDLREYNKSEHPFLMKLIAGFLYFIEYIIILPFLIFFWFSVFTLFLIILSQNQDVSQILIISGAVIAVIRLTAYYKESLSQEIAKILPFALLAIFLLNPNFLLKAQYFEEIINQLTVIPTFFNKIIYYLAFIIVIEIILRFFEFIFSLFESKETPKIRNSLCSTAS